MLVLSTVHKCMALFGVKAVCCSIAEDGIFSSVNFTHLSILLVSPVFVKTCCDVVVVFAIDMRL